MLVYVFFIGKIQHHFIMLKTGYLLTYFSVGSVWLKHSSTPRKWNQPDYGWREVGRRRESCSKVRGGNEPNPTLDETGSQEQWHNPTYVLTGSSCCCAESLEFRQGTRVRAHTNSRWEVIWLGSELEKIIKGKSPDNGYILTFTPTKLPNELEIEA